MLLFVIVIIIFNLYFLAVLRSELMDLGLLGRCSTTWATPPPWPFCFGYFWDWVSYLCLGWPGLWFSYLCFPHSWDDRDRPPYPAFVGWDRDLFLPGLPWNQILLNSTSQVARITGVSHHTWLIYNLYDIPGLSVDKNWALSCRPDHLQLRYA
jgi:hypothetical protein